MEEIIRYYREEGKPRGCLIAVGKNKIGWSLCHKNDVFNKEMARKIARGRAMKGTKSRLPWELVELLIVVNITSENYNWLEIK